MPVHPPGRTLTLFLLGTFLGAAGLVGLLVPHFYPQWTPGVAGAAGLLIGVQCLTAGMVWHLLVRQQVLELPRPSRWDRFLGPASGLGMFAIAELLGMDHPLRLVLLVTLLESLFLLIHLASWKQALLESSLDVDRHLRVAVNGCHGFFAFCEVMGLAVGARVLHHAGFNLFSSLPFLLPLLGWMALAFGFCFVLIQHLQRTTAPLGQNP